MSFIRAKEVEIEVEEEMAAKFERDSKAHIEQNEKLRKKLEEVDVMRKERDMVLEEEDRLKREHGKLNQQMIRWATSLNSVFKAMSVDLEQLGIFGGRVTADADVVMLMGVVEAKSQRILTAFNKFVATGGLNRSGTANSTNRLDNTMMNDPSSPITVKPASPPLLGGGGSVTSSALSLPQIIGKPSSSAMQGVIGGGGGGDKNGAGSGSEDEDDYESDDDEMIKPMRSVDLKRSMQASLNGSLSSPMGGFY
jgi:hypothetical protein